MSTTSNASTGAPKKNGIVEWVDYRLPIFTFMNHELREYPTPKNLNYWWNFGSLAGIVLVIMILSGIFLAMNYTAHVDHAFVSVERSNPVVPLVHQLTEPLLRPLRSKLPAPGGLDFSPFVVVLAILLARVLVAAPLLDFGMHLAQAA